METNVCPFLSFPSWESTYRAGFCKLAHEPTIHQIGAPPHAGFGTLLDDYLKDSRVEPSTTYADQSQSVVDADRVFGNISDHLKHSPFSGRDWPIVHVIHEQ
jgi:hypothetical protein